VRLLAVLASGLGVLLGSGRVLLALCVIALAVVFGRSAVGFGSALVMFGCFVVFVSSHWLSPAIRGRLRKLSEVGFGSSQPKKRPRSASREPTTEPSNNRSAGHEAQQYKTRRWFGNYNSFVLETTPIFGRCSSNGALAFDVATIIGLGVELFG
jgi:hypothetical protein